MTHQVNDNIVDKSIKRVHKLEAKGVKVFYDDFEAIKGIDMQIKANKVTAFIGPSGCGKSTFLRLFNRMNDYVDGFRMEGEVLKDGDNIYKKKVNVEQLRKQVGMVFQKPNPFPKSIYENVDYGLTLPGIIEKKHLNEIMAYSLTHEALCDDGTDDLYKSALALSGAQQIHLILPRSLQV